MEQVYVQTVWWVALDLMSELVHSGGGDNGSAAGATWLVPVKMVKMARDGSTGPIQLVHNPIVLPILL